MIGWREKLQDLIGMFTRIRAAWAKAERTIGATEPTQRLRISSEAYSDFSQNAPAADNSSDSHSGRWAHDMAELLKNAQGTLRGERDFTPEDIGQLRETMDAIAPIVAQSFWLRRRQPELGAPLDLFKSHLNELQATLEQSRVTLLAAGKPTG